MVRVPIIALAALALAGTAWADDTKIVPGVGIGKARLGMTEAQVRKAMGAPLARRMNRGAFGRRQIELHYGIAAYTIVLSGARTPRVASIGTTLASERTPQGHGVGTKEKVLADVLGAELACDRLVTTTFQGRSFVDLVNHPYRECTLRTGGAETVFRTAVRQAWGSQPEEWRPLAEVVEVVVRT